MPTNHPTDASEVTPDTKPRRWLKSVALIAASGAVSVAGTVFITLAATHKAAVHENAKAYANGLTDAWAAVRDGYYDPSTDDLFGA